MYGSSRGMRQQGDRHSDRLGEAVEHVGAERSLALEENAEHGCRDAGLAGDFVERPPTAMDRLAEVPAQRVLGRSLAHLGVALGQFRQFLPDGFAVDGFGPAIRLEFGVRSWRHSFPRQQLLPRAGNLVGGDRDNGQHVKIFGKRNGPRVLNRKLLPTHFPFLNPQDFCHPSFLPTTSGRIGNIKFHSAR